MADCVLLFKSDDLHFELPVPGAFEDHRRYVAVPLHGSAAICRTTELNSAGASSLIM
jgi:hypothetical protein